MSNPTKEIPADVMRAGVDAAYAAQDAKLGDASIGSIIGATVLARAILAERERCAKVADDAYDEAPSGHYDNGGTQDGWQLACQTVAAAIRRGGK